MPLQSNQECLCQPDLCFGLYLLDHFAQRPQQTDKISKPELSALGRTPVEGGHDLLVLGAKSRLPQEEHEPVQV
jgi:hypothetical protein